MKVLFVRNINYVPDGADEAVAIDTIQKATGLTVEVETIDVVLPTIYKSFDATSLVKGLWGLDGIKQQLRDTQQIPQDYYHMVVFFYKSSRTDVAYWTYPNDLNGSAFIEFPTRDEWKGSVKLGMCHEFLHACHRLCAFQGIVTLDDMDRYDGNLDPMNGSNYQRNIGVLQPYFQRIDTPLENWKKPGYIKRFLVQLLTKTVSVYKTLAIMQQQELLWDNPANVRHSCRVIMDEYNLSWAEKDLLCACIEQESRFKVGAIGSLNADGTRDYGLCQFNNGVNKETGEPFWIGKGADFASIDEVLADPSKNVRILVREYKKGNLKWWASYSTGAYKQFLPK